MPRARMISTGPRAEHQAPRRPGSSAAACRSAWCSRSSSLSFGAVSSGTRPEGSPPPPFQEAGSAEAGATGAFVSRMVRAISSFLRIFWRSREWTNRTSDSFCGAASPSRWASATIAPLIASTSVRFPRTRSLPQRGAVLTQRPERADDGAIGILLVHDGDAPRAHHRDDLQAELAHEALHVLVVEQLAAAH